MVEPVHQTPSNIPIPDPSLITAQEIAKARLELKAEFGHLLGGLKESILVRLDAADRAKELLSQELEKRQKITDGQLADLKAVQTAADQVVDARAQAANDGLERLLNSSINATTSISDVRHEATQLAITKVEAQLQSAFNASTTAVNAAFAAANSAVDAVDRKSIMRSDDLRQHLDSLEDKVLGRITAVKDLIDLGAAMGKEAITKAETASEKRFEGLNELRGAMSDQQASFLPRSEAEARFNSFADKLEQSMKNVAGNALDMKGMVRREDLRPITDDITKLRDLAAVSGGKEKVWAIVGGGALSVAAIIVALFAAFHIPTANPLVTADTNRINDLVTQMNAINAAQDARMTGLSNRMNQLTQPTPAK